MNNSNKKKNNNWGFIKQNIHKDIKPETKIGLIIELVEAFCPIWSLGGPTQTQFNNMLRQEYKVELDAPRNIKFCICK